MDEYRKDRIIADAQSSHPRNCINCDYNRFEVSDEEAFEGKIFLDSAGECRRHPPDTNGQFPPVNVLDGYCGDGKFD